MLPFSHDTCTASWRVCRKNIIQSCHSEKLTAARSSCDLNAITCSQLLQNWVLRTRSCPQPAPFPNNQSPACWIPETWSSLFPCPTFFKAVIAEILANTCKCKCKDSVSPCAWGISLLLSPRSTQCSGYGRTVQWSARPLADGEDRRCTCRAARWSGLREACVDQQGRWIEQGLL